MDVRESEELAERPHHDEELSRDSYLSPAFSSHADILSGRAGRQIAIALTVITEVTFYVVDKPAAVFQTVAGANRC